MSQDKMQQIREQLNAKIPRDAVATRDAGGGRQMSYLTGHYVINRLNEVFGPENWSYAVSELRQVFTGQVGLPGKETNYTSYVAQVNLRTKYPDGSVRIDMDVGFGDGQDKYNIGKTHELATKEAVTDALKRCAKSLGMSLGLALYSKDQENVEDEQPQPVAPKQAQVAVPPPAVGDSKMPTKQRDVEAVRKLIISAASALEAKKTITKVAFKEQYITQPYKVASIKELKDEQVLELFNTVKGKFTELQLQ